MSRRTAVYQSAATTCFSARSPKRRKVWSAARIAAAKLIEPMAILNAGGITALGLAKVANRLVPTMLEKITTGTPSQRFFLLKPLASL